MSHRFASGARPWAIAWAFLRRDLAIVATYRVAFLTRAIAVFVSIAGIALMARFVSGSGESELLERYGDAGYRGYWLLGFATANLFYVAISSLGRAIRRAQLEGTLEALLSTPASTPVIVLCTPLADNVMAGLRVVATVILGAWILDLDFSRADLAALALTLPAALLAFAALALLGGAVTLVLRHTDPFTTGVAMVSALVGGVVFPVQLLPAPLADLSYAIPLAPALEALRQALFAGAGPAAIGRELAALGLFAAIVGTSAAALLAAALRRARMDNSLSQY